MPSRFALLLCCAALPGDAPAVPAATPRHTHPAAKRLWPLFVSSRGAAMRLAGSAVFSSFPDPSDPAKTAQSGPAGPGPQDRSTGPARAGPAGATQLRVGPSDSGCGGMLIPAGGAAGSPGTAALHTQCRRRPPPPPPHFAAVSAGDGGAGAALGLHSGPLAGPAAALQARGALLAASALGGSDASRRRLRLMPLPALESQAAAVSVSARATRTRCVAGTRRPASHSDSDAQRPASIGMPDPLL